MVMGPYEDSGADEKLGARLQRLIAVFELALDELRQLVELHEQMTGPRDALAAAGHPDVAGPDLPLPYPDNVAQVSHLSHRLGSLVAGKNDRDLPHQA